MSPSGNQETKLNEAPPASCLRGGEGRAGYQQHDDQHRRLNLLTLLVHTNTSAQQDELLDGRHDPFQPAGIPYWRKLQSNGAPPPGLLSRQQVLEIIQLALDLVEDDEILES